MSLGALATTTLRRLAHSRHIRKAIIGHDLAMAVVVSQIALLVPVNFGEPSIAGPPLLTVLGVLILVQGVIFSRCGLYHAVWRFASIQDLANILRAVGVGTLALAGLYLLSPLQGIPGAAWLLYPMLLAVLLGGPRLAWRLWKDHQQGVRAATQPSRVLIVGAGAAGEALARDLTRHPDYLVLGFVDDDRRLRGSRVHGIPVLGRFRRLPRLCDEFAIDLILIAMPEASKTDMRRIVELCEQAGVRFQTLPRLQDVLDGRVGLRRLREVRLDDLLGREPVSLDWDGMFAELNEKVAMITGAGGSIGSELCRQVAAQRPAALVLVERCEFNLYEVDREIREAFPTLRVHACLADVCDEASIDRIMECHRPCVVFHTAAYKHVPLLELQLREAIHNNVIGTRSVALAGERHGVETFVLISTDKAVNPTNIMGASKRVAEIYCQNLDRISTARFITVRFGNVLGSRGSVVPLFQAQIEQGGPVTVTDPDITRYFMTNREACQLIMQAATMGHGGEIFVLNMGEPLRIVDLAEELIRLSGHVPYEGIPIEFVGLRPGEKLHEELFHAQETLVGTDCQGILQAGHRLVDWRFLEAMIDRLESACREQHEDLLLEFIAKLVPEMDLSSSTHRTEYRPIKELSPPDAMGGAVSLDQPAHSSDRLGSDTAGAARWH